MTKCLWLEASGTHFHRGEPAVLELYWGEPWQKEDFPGEVRVRVGAPGEDLKAISRPGEVSFEPPAEGLYHVQAEASSGGRELLAQRLVEVGHLHGEAAVPEVAGQVFRPESWKAWHAGDKISFGTSAKNKVLLYLQGSASPRELAVNNGLLELKADSPGRYLLLAEDEKITATLTFWVLK